MAISTQKKEEEPNANDDNNQKGLLGMVGSGIGSVATFLFTSPPQSKNKGRSQESLLDPEKKKDNDDAVDQIWEIGHLRRRVRERAKNNNKSTKGGGGGGGGAGESTTTKEISKKDEKNER